MILNYNVQWKHTHAQTTLSFQFPALLSPVQVPGSASKAPVIHQNNKGPRLLLWLGEQHRCNEGGKDSYFVFSPALLSFIETLSIALFLPALCLCLACPYNLVRKGGTEGLRGEKGMQCIISLYMTFSASFNINSGELEIWMLRIQTETAGTLTALVLVLCLHVLKC